MRRINSLSVAEKSVLVEKLVVSDVKIIEPRPDIDQDENNDEEQKIKIVEMIIHHWMENEKPATYCGEPIQKRNYCTSQKNDNSNDNCHLNRKIKSEHQSVKRKNNDKYKIRPRTRFSTEAEQKEKRINTCQYHSGIVKNDFWVWPDSDYIIRFVLWCHFASPVFGVELF